jgi:acetate kinase
MLYEKSGLLGVSGLSSDMRTLLASEDPHAKEAIELFVFRIVREICALAASLGGLDGLVFTAGIGEHSPEIRDSVCKGLHWLGVALGSDTPPPGTTCISTPKSAIAVHVIPTDEEAMIAQHTVETL